MHVMLTRGYSVEYFVEGGRSRTGRTLQPRPGMLSMTVRSFLRDHQKPIVLVPVYIGYENVMEGRSYLGELQGKKKKQESVVGLAKTARKLRSSFGKVSVNFGRGIDLDTALEQARPGWKNEATGREARPRWLNAAVNHLAREVATGEARTIDEVSGQLGCSPAQLVKTLIVKGTGGETGPALVALLIRGDQEINTVKIGKLSQVAEPLALASDEEVREAVGCAPGCIGPLSLKMPVVADHSVTGLQNFICGANRNGYHLLDANWGRDCHYDEAADLRNVQEGNLAPDGKGTLSIKRGIEVGHIFQLGRKYSEAMNASVLDENGRSVHMTMGCYGIGVSRIVAAAIEQNHDDRGIIWPETIAPFQVALIPLGAHKSEAVAEKSESLYRELLEAGYEVLMDDRDKKTSPGVKFADMELMGIPHRLVVSDRGLGEGTIEYRGRRDAESQHIPADELLEFLAGRLSRDAA
jgi:prolyl-tRNA synthetase